MLSEQGRAMSEQGRAQPGRVCAGISALVGRSACILRWQWVFWCARATVSRAAGLGSKPLTEPFSAHSGTTRHTQLELFCFFVCDP